ncbi:DUF2889 domain-containing protein [Spongiibacter nanhainus]|uniref:DUF2889 domain-containing protein n=1 Tax=Spongiibacter nanhainus TaxID=2794344 RepID=A0A7T4R0G2_9GAMM|nr:DUF2889 domain-containing protein [Spongiibacter nanhainus]QQD18136.1 DUF2889 domain-containing protein [Spongiibacter nanhainus]
MSQDPDYRLNPDYGPGRYRRRIELVAGDGWVDGELEDTNHGFRCRLHHDGKQVTRVTGEALRIPFTTCPGAVEPLKALAGLPLVDDASAIIAQTQPNEHCTHLFDLTVLALCHAARVSTSATAKRRRRIDIVIEDQPDQQPAPAEVYIDDRLIHRWLTLDWQIVEPQALAGRGLYKGFTAWASETFDGEQSEAAFALQKGYFVGSARRFDLSALVGKSANDERDYMLGACYTYSSPQIERARRTAGSVRDFSDTPEQLLQFVDARGAATDGAT